MSARLAYAATAEALVERIRALVPDHPELLTMRSAWDLFKVPGFKCDDLDVTAAMASAALAQVQHEHRKKETP